jgi:hypothetical protein
VLPIAKDEDPLTRTLPDHKVGPDHSGVLGGERDRSIIVFLREAIALFTPKSQVVASRSFLTVISPSPVLV